MRELRYTLVAEGTSDKRLLPILTWLVQQHTTRAIAATWANLTILAPSPRTLPERVAAAIEFYPCDLLFVHRDADNQPRELRMREITEACGAYPEMPRVAVIPVRMQETWLLIDEGAIRTAAGRPLGRTPLGLPPRAALESRANPKQVLYEALRTASGLTGRHLARFNVLAAAYRVSEIVRDFTPLRGLPSFDALEGDLKQVLARYDLR